jgi:hypothetical protein
VRLAVPLDLGDLVHRLPAGPLLGPAQVCGREPSGRSSRTSTSVMVERRPWMRMVEPVEPSRVAALVGWQTRLGTGAIQVGHQFPNSWALSAVKTASPLTTAPSAEGAPSGSRNHKPASPWRCPSGSIRGRRRRLFNSRCTAGHIHLLDRPREAELASVG